MKKIICDKLNEIEARENVKILHCTESGSRAWGFASPDSDYDVRFIYVRPKEFYLRLDKTRDVIEWQLDETLDINGWDLQKALRLLHNSNPTLFEWNSSPIVYRTTEEWQNISAVINDYFVAKSGLYHYLNTAENNYRKFLKSEQVRLKEYFYALRPLLACKWIIARGTPPPIPFSQLTGAYLDEKMKPHVERLLSIKTDSPEISTGRRIDELNEYIEKTTEEISSYIQSCPAQPERSWEKLNAIFLNCLK